MVITISGEELDKLIVGIKNARSRKEAIAALHLILGVVVTVFDDTKKEIKHGNT